MKSVAVVIPTYSERMKDGEKSSLDTFRKHLSQHDVIFASPEGMDVSAYLRVFPEAECRRFPSCDFRTVKTYSKLLKSGRFYGCFRDYEYILICQLDCLVFRDELAAWCGRRFSYIGPPWADFNFIGGWKRSLFRLLPFGKRLFPSVGNGGFSLREVAIHFRLAKKYRWLSLILFWLHEDLFWCGVVGRLEKTYTIPPSDVALRFGVECHPEESFALLGNQLPFGCHAWERNSPQFWRERLELHTRARFSEINESESLHSVSDPINL